MTIRVSRIVVFSVLAASLSLGSCTLLPSPRAREVYVRPGAEDSLRTRPLAVAGISVDAGVATPRVEENARYIYSLLLEKLNAGRASGDGEELYLLVSIAEAPFVAGFETRNAVSVETRVFEGAPASGTPPMVIALYSEESESTVGSYRYLLEVIQASLVGLLR